ncbi:hypothetical protein DRN73_01650 [Candidatus Pacearchaeota archaeon]|nr:MAG: hypothetical protein DRN73_01650 [Candidatus Pacearchaeota archaeon]
MRKLKKKSLWSKIKDIGRAGLLIPSLILGQGCVGDIKELGTEWRPEREIVKKLGDVKTERTNNQTDHYFVQATQKKDSQIKININKETDEIYEVKQEIDYYKKQRKYRIYTKEEYDKDSKGTKAAIGLGAAGLLIMLGSDEDSYWKSFGGVMLAISIGIGSSSGTPKKYTDATENIRLIPYSTEYKTLRKERYPGIKGPPGKFVPVTIDTKDFSFQDNLKTLQTNPNGKTTIKLEERVLGWAFTKQDLEKEIRNSNLIRKQVKERYQEEFSKLLTKYASTSFQEVELRTDVKENSLFRKVNNSRTRVSLKGYSINKNSIENALRDFVKKEVSASLTKGLIQIRDRVSHSRISKAMIEFTNITGVPTKDKLLEPYLSGDLKSIAKKYLPDYLGSRKNKSEIIYTDQMGEAQVLLYSTTKASAEITNSRYYFLDREIKSQDFKKGLLILDMNDKGEKIRKKEVKQ